ncbi:GGDEF domain-containing protein [Spongisporangium articulatum]|uniref:GGDEF domain-containing protein n=1 Tax=Spongisporangium articulatum TaxID=3362603 RepID=A0ABW8ANB3_9ACTN
MTSAALAPTADDPATVGLPRLCGGFAAVHALLAVLSLTLPDVPNRPWLVLVDGAVAVVLAALAFMSATRRLPRWRREAFATAVPLIAVAAATARVGLIGHPWPAAELVLAASASVLVTSRTLFMAVMAGCGAGWLVAMALDGVRGTSDDGTTSAFVTSWTHLGLLLLASCALAIAVRRARATSAVALVEAHRNLLEQSVRDPLTGLANRKGLMMFARPMIDLARRQGEAVHCLVVDVDTLRDVNEQHGVGEGDEVLLAVAAALNGGVRTTDVVARWGGDEFVLLGPGTGVSPLEMERRVRAHLAQTEDLPRGAWQGKVSVGSATLVPWDGDDLDGLLHRAEQDLALRRSLKRRAAARMQAEDEIAGGRGDGGADEPSGTTAGGSSSDT